MKIVNNFEANVNVSHCQQQQKALKFLNKEDKFQIFRLSLSLLYCIICILDLAFPFLRQYFCLIHCSF